MNALRAFVGWWTRSQRWMVALLVVLSLIKGIVWVSAYPLWKIADEPAHFGDVQFRAEHHFRTPLANGTPIERVISGNIPKDMRRSWEATQYYHRERHFKYASTVPEEAELTRLAKDLANHDSDGQTPAMSYPGFYYSVAAIAYRLVEYKSIVNRCYAVRLVSVLFGLLAVLATFFAARRTFDEPALAFAAAIMVGLQPMFSQQTAAVNNDAGVIGMCALVFYLQFRVIDCQRPNFLEGALLGVAIALAICSKPQGWVMLLTSIPVLVYLSLRTGRDSWKTWIATFGGYEIIMAVAARWPAEMPPAAKTAAAAAASVTTAAPPAAPEFPISLSTLADRAVEFVTWVDNLDVGYRDYLLRSAFGQFSWLEFSIGQSWVDAVYRAWPLCWAGLIVAGATWVLRQPSTRLWWRPRAAVLSAMTAGAAVVAILYVEFFAGAPGAIQGRNFLFGSPAFAILIMLGLGSLVPRKLRPLTAALVVTAAVCLNIGALICIVRQHDGG
jgi:4-amino-4-deoxy-L-arabinose transferase-like glycosyltransferase